MQFEISGKGIVCNVYYIEQQKLEDISGQVSPTGPGLKDLLLEHSDFIVNVAKGFFVDSSLYKFEFKLSNGEVVSQEFFEDKIAKLLEEDMTFEEDEDPRDYKYVNHAARVQDITNTQVGLVEYHEFQHGVISLEIPCEDIEKIKGMRFLCESVDKGSDFATTATYMENVVGGEEYESSESAIDAIEIDGIKYSLPQAKFDRARSRVWLWTYDEESEQHQMDFLGSQSLPDPWEVELIDLTLDDLYEDYDQDYEQLNKVKRFFNQQSLDWIKDNPAFVSKYLTANSCLKNLVSSDDIELELPNITQENIGISTFTILCMFLNAFGVKGLDPEKLSQLEDFDLLMLDLDTLTLGNEVLRKSVQKSFAMHFGVLGEISMGDDESFSEMENPALTDVIQFVSNMY